MAKKKEVSKMQAVREVLEQKPDASPTEIVAGVQAAHGIEMTPAMASNYKSVVKGGGKKKGKKTGTSSPAGDGQAVGVLEDLVRLLGKDRTKQLIDTM